ncbi:chemotaxis protein CheW [Limisalsivibrio acetivorans]|uniref:chemotaxis protein CheW n=1 Tax=Limisalsivibrio acetivorans TaxID=1304888 RepID=UPI0003B55BDE|nr:chemotaxis protein CheW [Limisalsivibrio acetivorans]
MSSEEIRTATKMEKMERYLTFELGGEHYGVNVHCVKEIIAMMKITSVPNVPEYIKGVINLRGQIIPVVDMRLKFNLPKMEYTAQTIIIIVLIGSGEDDSEKTQVGFIVDATNEVLPVTHDKLSAPPKFGTSVDTDFIDSVYQNEDRVVMMIDLQKIFSEEELLSMETNASR